MSNNTKRLEGANLKLKNTGVSFMETGGVLVIERPGDPSSTAHGKVQRDLGPTTATYASWCLDAALGVPETAVEPTDQQKLSVLKDTGFAYPEKAPKAEAAESKK